MLILLLKNKPLACVKLRFTRPTVRYIYI